jgi:hypothetical protein
MSEKQVRAQTYRFGGANKTLDSLSGFEKKEEAEAQTKSDLGSFLMSSPPHRKIIRP